MKRDTRLITVFGGSGFVGRYVVRALAKRGYRVRVAVRRPDLAHHLQPLGDFGQIKAVQANVRNRNSIDRAVAGADVVVNLVGILQPSGRNKFGAVQEFGARAIAESARSAKSSLVHVSAIGADVHASSVYGRSKGLGEKAVRETVKNAIIFRPSIIFGPEDDFFNRFSAIARISPFLPLIGGGHNKFQPVYVGDVAEAIARAVDGDIKGGAVYELGGPQVVSFRQCLDLMQQVTGRKRAYLPLPWFAARMIGKLLGWLPGAPITYDQVKMLESDNVVSQPAIRQRRTLEGIGIKAHQMEAILPTYLGRFRSHGQFTRIDEA